MNHSTLRHLAAEHRSLHTSPLPPNYLFPPSSTSSSTTGSADLTQLDLLLAGADGTPYAKGVWQVHLKFPDDYPASPPKASFRTKIWHPNIDEATGSVCVDTLKRDWPSAASSRPSKNKNKKDLGLKLRDILVTISCLLIQPNPDSALNANAAKLFQEDFDAFRKQVELMTSIHAAVPSELRKAVLEAKRRGEDVNDRGGDDDCENGDENMEWSLEETTTKRRRVDAAKGMTKGLQMTLPQRSIATVNSSSTTAQQGHQRSPITINPAPIVFEDSPMDEPHPTEEDDEVSEEEASKENDPSLSPMPVTSPPPLPLPSDGNHKRKRPLSTIPLPLPVPVCLPPPASPVVSGTGPIPGATPIFVDDEGPEDGRELTGYSSPRKHHVEKQHHRETGLPMKGAVTLESGLAIRGININVSSGSMTTKNIPAEDDPAADGLEKSSEAVEMLEDHAAANGDLDGDDAMKTGEEIYNDEDEARAAAKAGMELETGSLICPVSRFEARQLEERTASLPTTGSSIPIKAPSTASTYTKINSLPATTATASSTAKRKPSAPAAAPAKAKAKARTGLRRL